MVPLRVFARSCQSKKRQLKEQVSLLFCFVLLLLLSSSVSHSYCSFLFFSFFARDNEHVAHTSSVGTMTLSGMKYHWTDTAKSVTQRPGRSWSMSRGNCVAIVDRPSSFCLKALRGRSQSAFLVILFFSCFSSLFSACRISAVTQKMMQYSKLKQKHVFSLFNLCFFRITRDKKSTWRDVDFQKLLNNCIPMLSKRRDLVTRCASIFFCSCSDFCISSCSFQT